MAFGKIMVNALAAAPQKKKKEAPIQPAVKAAPVQEKGDCVVNILLVAHSCEEAADYLCGAYFNLVQALGGSNLTAYTREFSTISKLSETKQSLEEMVLKPVGREYIRRTAEDEVAFDQCTMTLGQTGNPSLGLNVHFIWGEPGSVAGAPADVVFVLLNCAEGAETAARTMNTVRSGASGRPVFWILTNFENRKLFWHTDGDAAPKVEIRSKLREILDVSCRPGEYVAYAQIYGGLEFADRKNGKAVLRTDARCREYMPVGCHVPVIAGVDVLQRHRKHQEESVTPDATMERICLLMQAHHDKAKGWYDGYSEKGGARA